MKADVPIELENMTNPPNKAAEVPVYEVNGTYSFLPFPLRPGKSGKVEVTSTIKPKGSILTVVSLRNSMFMGLPASKTRLEHNVEVFNLAEEGVSDQWMTTFPQEVEQHERQLKNAHGHVLVGGLGLGLAVGILRMKPKVRSITVVEINPDVIRLVATPAMHHPLPNDRKGLKTVMNCCDIRRFLKNAKTNGLQYDFAFYDTWCPTGQRTLITDTLPLRRLSIGVVPNDQIECWNEDEMIGQVAAGAQFWCNREKQEFMRAAGHTDPFTQSRKEFRTWRTFNRETYPFLAWMKKTQPTNTQATSALRQYLYCLKDPEAFDEHWKKYDSYGK